MTEIITNPFIVKFEADDMTHYVIDTRDNAYVDFFDRDRVSNPGQAAEERCNALWYAELQRNRVNLDTMREEIDQVVREATDAALQRNDDKLTAMIDRAVKYLDAVHSVIVIGDTVVVASTSDATKSYAASRGACQCTAAHFNNRCVHRVIARIVVRAMEITKGA